MSDTSAEPVKPDPGSFWEGHSGGVCWRRGSMAYAEWNMVVICIWCALFVTSQSVSKPTFWRSLLNNMHILMHALPIIYVSLN